MQNPEETYQATTTIVDNGQTIISNFEIMVKGEPDRKLYDIWKDNSIWMVKSYEAGKYILTIETHENDNTIQNFVSRLALAFRQGKVLEGTFENGYVWRSHKNAFWRILKRPQIQAILRFERDSGATNLPVGVVESNPTKLSGFYDFGDYGIEVWNKSEKKKKYEYITFNPTAKNFLDKLIAKH